ncbi:hypothetical protein NEF87_004846 [Candidatus Lokiarchaeum ossiferum]|uniref:Endonuclease GajA/Old nuclease/RecF-like AAA domain-containing protein n=1 Tax=Candidatus Lokiarchaeum ossiferum TaxID=2951803 RepID=A0ABY6HYY9_9ARCH|nr:hypothetical protein NEF87_004846 [Candidatus Lokiarchaeum sp. B-35]
MTISRLHRVEIFNLLSFDHQVFENIGELGVIIGPNNAGKSNFFKILEKIRPNQNLNHKFIMFDENPALAKIIINFKFEKLKLREFFVKNSKHIFRSRAKDYILDPESFKIYKNRQYDEKESLTIEEAFANIIFELILMPGSNNRVFIKKVSFQNEWFSHSFGEKKNLGSNYSFRILDLSNPTHVAKTIEKHQEWRYIPENIFHTSFPNSQKNMLDDKNYFEILKVEPFLYFFLKPIVNFHSKMRCIKEDRFFNHFSKIKETNDIKALDATGNKIPTLILEYDTNQRSKLDKLCNYLFRFYPSLLEINQNFLVKPDYALFDPKYNSELNRHISDFPITIPYLKEKKLDYKLTFDKLGKGIQQLVIILAFILETEEDGILLIEEPELFIHPQLQKILLSIIKENLGKYQVLITTHSPYFIDNSEEDWSIHRVKRVDKVTQVFNDSKENLDILFQDLGIKPSDYLMNNGMILVEGKDDIEFFKNAIPGLLEDNRIVLQQLGGKRDVHYWANAKLIQHFTNKNFKFLIILDNDEGNTEILKNRAVEIQEKILLLPVREIENLYLNPEILLEMIKSSSNPLVIEPTLELIKQIIKSAVDEQMIRKKQIKFFFNEFPKVFSEKDKKKISKTFVENKEGETRSQETRVDSFLKTIEDFITKHKHISLDKQFYKERFATYAKEIELIIKKGEEWKEFPGKELKLRVFAECSKKFGFIYEKDNYYRIIQEKGFVKEKLLDKISQKLNLN